MLRQFVVLVASLLLLSQLSVARSEDGFLSGWMGHTMPVLGHRCLLDLALPGTHDTLTYDLSERIADNANDLGPELAAILHDLVPKEIFGHWIRDMAVTQRQNVTMQLNAGVRFLDYRITWTKGPDGEFGPYDWYALHFVESNRKAITYFEEVRDWLVAHPDEVVVLWVSRHGNTELTGTDQYPGTTPAIRQAMWDRIVSSFDGLLFDTRVSSANATSLSTLVERNHRVVVYAADWANFTASSPLAYDSRLIDNRLWSKFASNFSVTLPTLLQQLSTVEDIRKQDKAGNRFLLVSLASGQPTDALLDLAELSFQPFDHDKIRTHCGSFYRIKDCPQCCPMTLLNCSSLGNYYQVPVLQQAFQSGYSFPNAFYINDVRADGGVLIGAEQGSHSNAAWAYVPTLVASMVFPECSSHPTTGCADIVANLKQRMASHPVQRWNDLETCRLATWP